MWETSWKGGKKHSDPFIYNHSGVDLALFSVPARELKWSSNSYYKAINLWVLTYASPLAICFLYRGLTVKLAVLIKRACIRCYCPLLLDVSTAARGNPIHTAPTPGQFPDPRRCWCSGHYRTWSSHLLHLTAVESDTASWALAAFTRSLRWTRPCLLSSIQLWTSKGCCEKAVGVCCLEQTVTFPKAAEVWLSSLWSHLDGVAGTNPEISIGGAQSRPRVPLCCHAWAGAYSSERAHTPPVIYFQSIQASLALTQYYKGSKLWSLWWY